MKVILYALILAEGLVIIYLTDLMVDRPFNNHDMRTSYYNGCNLGQFHINSSSFTCSKSATSYERELDHLDDLMDK